MHQRGLSSSPSLDTRARIPSFCPFFHGLFLSLALRIERRREMEPLRKRPTFFRLCLSFSLAPKKAEERVCVEVRDPPCNTFPWKGEREPHQDSSLSLSLLSGGRKKVEGERKNCCSSYRTAAAAAADGSLRPEPAAVVRAAVAAAPTKSIFHSCYESFSSLLGILSLSVRDNPESMLRHIYPNRRSALERYFALKRRPQTLGFESTKLLTIILSVKDNTLYVL